MRQAVHCVLIGYTSHMKSGSGALITVLSIWCIAPNFAMAQNSELPAGVRAYRVGGTQTIRLTGAVSVSSSDPSIPSDTHNITAAELVPLPQLPSGSTPACLIRAGDTWVVASAGGTRSTGESSDTVSSSLDSGGTLIIHRTIRGVFIGGFPQENTTYQGTTAFDLNTGAAVYSFTQSGTFGDDNTTFTYSANAQQDLR